MDSKGYKKDNYGQGEGDEIASWGREKGGGIELVQARGEFAGKGSVVQDPGGGAPEDKGQDSIEEMPVNLQAHSEQELENQENGHNKGEGIGYCIDWIEPAICQDRVQEIIFKKAHNHFWLGGIKMDIYFLSPSNCMETGEEDFELRITTRDNFRNALGRYPVSELRRFLALVDEVRRSPVYRPGIPVEEQKEIVEEYLWDRRQDRGHP